MTELDHRLVGLMLTAALSGGACAGSPTNTLHSPHGVFAVTFYGSGTAPTLPLLASRLIGSVDGRTGTLCTGVELHRAHWFDTSFDRSYATAHWEQENVIRFRALPVAADRPSDRLVIRNDTDRVVPCLKVYLSDLLLVMDVKAGATFELDVSRPPGGDVCFSVTAIGRDISVEPATVRFERSDYPVNASVTSTVRISNKRLSLAVALSAS